MVKIIFKNRTQYSKKVYKEFLEFHQKKYGIFYTTYTVVITIAILFCIVLQLQSQNTILAIFTLAILCAFLLWRFYHPIKIVEKEIKTKPIQKEQEFVFAFSEKYFWIYGPKTNERMSYWKLRKIFETERFFYLYIDKTHAFLLDKQKFEMGTSEDFHCFIKKKCPFRFSAKIVK